MNSARYQMLIQWSEQDQCYVVSLPDFSELMQPCTDGATYEEAALHGRQLIESLIEWYAEDGQNLPTPKTLQVA